jgi:hypothetical protein
MLRQGSMQPAKSTHKLKTEVRSHTMAEEGKRNIQMFLKRREHCIYKRGNPRDWRLHQSILATGKLYRPDLYAVGNVI